MANNDAQKILDYFKQLVADEDLKVNDRKEEIRKLQAENENSINMSSLINGKIRACEAFLAEATEETIPEEEKKK